jgi:endogenous inhibitor of DNA gyrase (YacG/DUF329 family)
MIKPHLCGWTEFSGTPVGSCSAEDMAMAKEKTMTDTIRGTRYNPCKGCPDRYPACSAYCQKEEYLKWKAEQETIRRNRKAYNEGAWFREEVYEKRSDPTKRRKREPK